MIRQRMLCTAPMYDPKLKARVVPWAHKWHTWIGFAYQFDDEGQPGKLIYIVPQMGSLQFKVHMTDISIDADDSGNVMLSMESGPDPDNDEEVKSFKL